MESRSIDGALQPQHDALLHHPLHLRLSDARSVARFMEGHVFAVWDFMSLVKSLQGALTCVDFPWLPVGDPAERRFINEIVLDEESDLDASGRPRSHFELYVDAMSAVGADTRPIDRFVEALRRTRDPEAALSAVNATSVVRSFVRTTLDLAGAEVLEVAAAFAYGRELVIPPIFRELVRRLRDREPERLAPLAFYLERHIQTDGTKHGPAAHRLVARLIGGDPAREARAIRAARLALEARRALWDEIADTIDGG